VPKYVSNDRFSCMITMTCAILWMPTGAAPGADTPGPAAGELEPGTGEERDPTGECTVPVQAATTANIAAPAATTLRR